MITHTFSPHHVSLSRPLSSITPIIHSCACDGNPPPPSSSHRCCCSGPVSPPERSPSLTYMSCMSLLLSLNSAVNLREDSRKNKSWSLKCDRCERRCVIALGRSCYSAYVRSRPLPASQSSATVLPSTVLKKGGGEDSRRRDEKSCRSESLYGGEGGLHLISPLHPPPLDGGASSQSALLRGLFNNVEEG